jgi:hypothetical protein
MVEVDIVFSPYFLCSTVNTFDFNEVQTQVTYHHQDPMQRRLVGNLTTNHGVSAFLLDAEAFKPGSPIITDVALDPDMISTCGWFHLSTW